MSRYEICIRGAAGEVIADAFSDLTVTAVQGRTTMVGDLPDRAALHRVLDRVHELGLVLLWLEAKEGPVAPPISPHRGEVGR